MKNILLVIVTLLMGVQMVAQENKVIIQKCDYDSLDNYQNEKVDLFKGENYIHTLVQKKAQPKEGFKMFFENLNLKEKVGNKIQRPLTLNQIVIRIRFVVEKDGSLTNMVVLTDELNIANDVFQIIKE